MRKFLFSLCTFAAFGGACLARPADAAIPTPQMPSYIGLQTPECEAQFAATGPARGRALWVWSSAAGANPTERLALLDWAEQNQVSAIYITDELILKYGAEAMMALTADAAARCMEVEIMAGDPDWGLAQHHGKALARAKQIIDAIQATPAGAPRPTGLHFDIEPYLVPEWKSDLQGVANQFLTVLDLLRFNTRAAGLRFSVDVPYWFDSKQVTRFGVTRPLHEWVIDRVDRVTLMDYRDTPEGVIAGGAEEVAYAQKTGRQIMLGVESLCGLDPVCTFCEEGRGALEAALAGAAEAFAAQPSMIGFALHHYGSLRTMKP